MDDVLVVGGGPVGLINAIGLARHGLTVRVLEAELGALPTPRAMVYHRQVLDGLMLLDLFDDAARAGFLSNETCSRYFKSGRAFVTKHPYPEGLDCPYTLTLAIDELTEVAMAHIERYPQINCMWGARFTGLKQYDDFVEVEAETLSGTETFRARWVIGADGGRSDVRRAIGQHLVGYTWPDRFVATNMRFDFEGNGWHPLSNVVVDNHFGAMIVRLTQGGQWRVTFHEDARLPLESLRERIFEYYRRVLPNAAEGAQLDLFSPYSMHQRCVEKMRVGRVVLAGDSAHITNPTSGFGLVGGMLDSFVLIDALAAVIRGERSDDILDAYSKARRGVFLNITSPVSCESKRRVFHLTDQQLVEEQERLLEAQKSTAAAGLNYIYRPGTVSLETPSLVTGLTTAEERMRKLGPAIVEKEHVFA